MPHNLTTEQEADIDRVIRIIVATGEPFSTWASNAITKNGQYLFGQERGPGSLHLYCKDGKFKNRKRSLQKFQQGTDTRVNWKPLTRLESDPTDLLQAIHPIRKLTDEEFQNQSIMAGRGTSPKPVGTDRTTPKKVKGKPKNDDD